MLNIINRHLDFVDGLQTEVEGHIRAALAAITPQELLSNLEALPEEIAEELATWISDNLLDEIQAAAIQFLTELDGEYPDSMDLDHDRIHTLILLLLDNYQEHVRVTVAATLAAISNSVDLQTQLGRTEESIAAELNGNASGLGTLLTGMENKLIHITDAFISSASAIAPIESVTGELTWLTVQDKKVCDSCLPRHGVSNTAEYWVENGLPRTGWSLCKEFCRCLLVSTSAFERNGRPAPVERNRRTKNVIV